MDAVKIISDSAGWLAELNKKLKDKKKLSKDDNVLLLNLQWLNEMVSGRPQSGPYMPMLEFNSESGSYNQEVYFWRKKFDFPKTENGNLSIKAALKWFRDEVIKKHNEQPETPIDTKLKEKRIEKLEIENAIKLKDYIPKAIAKERTLQAFRSVSNILQYAKRRIAPMLVGSKSSFENEKIIDAQWEAAIKTLDVTAIEKEWEQENNGNA